MGWSPADQKDETGGSRVFVTNARVRYADTDQSGMAYHANYLHWFEDGRNSMLRELGRPYSQVEREDGTFLTVMEATIRYSRPARYDETVKVESRLAELRRVRLKIETRILNEEGSLLLAEGHVWLASVDGSGRPTAFPASLREVLEQARG